MEFEFRSHFSGKKVRLMGREIRYFPMSKDGIGSVVGKRGLFMCRIASVFLLQRLKGSMSGDARVWSL